ncbi:uncharacterized protein [Heptranchias perlo]|uniref:uncharacterized protein n=1 Tax=Heptranchias perlo TaxID=212740 RepID=UPI003559B49F
MTLQVSTDSSRTILEIQHHLSQGHHNILRSPDETEASVHSLAYDESVQSTHAVKSDTGEINGYEVLDTLTEEQARAGLSDSHLTMDEQKGQMEELFARSSSSQMADQDCDERDRIRRLLMGPDMSVTLRPTSDLSTFHLLTEEFIKMYMKIIEFKESIIQKLHGNEEDAADVAVKEEAIEILHRIKIDKEEIKLSVNMSVKVVCVGEVLLLQ